MFHNQFQPNPSRYVSSMLITSVHLCPLIAAWAFTQPTAGYVLQRLLGPSFCPCSSLKCEPFCSQTVESSSSSTFNANAFLSSVNSIIDGLSSFSISLTPLPSLSHFLETATPGASLNTDCPYVSDVVSSYSHFMATRTGDEPFSFATPSGCGDTTAAATTTSMGKVSSNFPQR